MPDQTIQQLPLGTPLARIVKKYFGALTIAAENSGIDKYFSVLIYLGNSKEKVTQQMLADFLMIDKASMARIMDHLQELGLLTKKINENNRREFILKLTSKGKITLKKLNTKMDELHGKVFEGFSAGEKKIFFNMLQRLSYNLDHLPAAEMRWELKSYKTKK